MIECYSLCVDFWEGLPDAVWLLDGRLGSGRRAPLEYRGAYQRTVVYLHACGSEDSFGFFFLHNTNTRHP